MNHDDLPTAPWPSRPTALALLIALLLAAALYLLWPMPGPATDTSPPPAASTQGEDDT